MAKKNFTMKNHNGTGWDDLYPKTKRRHGIGYASPLVVFFIFLALFQRQKAFSPVLIIGIPNDHYMEYSEQPNLS